MSGTSAATIASRNGAKAHEPGGESSRIAFLLARDGDEATLAWVRRTLAIYRRAVLSRGHFAGSSDYRRLFLASCADFRRWLAEQRNDRQRPPPAHHV